LFIITNNPNTGDNMAVSAENKKRWSSDEWKTLTMLQNTWFPNQDIMTITGFMNHDQFIDHVERYKQYAKEDAIKNNMI
tara:strand:+ start:284 stop:520 length:237 start_codon:yes stop_codon:yes gene_type:complete